MYCSHIFDGTINLKINVISSHSFHLILSLVTKPITAFVSVYFDHVNIMHCIVSTHIEFTVYSNLSGKLFISPLIHLYKDIYIENNAYSSSIFSNKKGLYTIFEALQIVLHFINIFS